jgi:ribonucleotide reductase class II
MWSISLYRTFSNTDAVEYLNTHSLKLTERPVILSNNIRSAHPFAIKTIEFETSPDYSYDFAVSGQDDDDSWYWQGALKSHNTKSLLTGAASGWAPPKAARYIRRITFSKNDPVALASLDYGYSVVPAQKDTDDDGGLLNDPFDPRCTEWLVEIPVETCWANLPGVEDIDISQFSALAQFDFYMQVQKYYTEHNTSATIELREHEIDGLAERIHQAIENDEGYISSALLARFDCNETFPRLPFEPISKEKYEQLTQEVLERRISDDFHELLLKYDTTIKAVEGPSGCDSDKCLLPERPNPVRDISNLKGNIFDKVD